MLATAKAASQTMPMSTSIPVAVALNNAGWHPAAWNVASDKGASVLDPAWWTALAQIADRGNVDFVTFEDALSREPRPEHAAIAAHSLRTDRLDAVLLANFLAARTERVGLIPTASSTHTEPFHVATAIQTLDHVSRGRAGLRTQVSALPSEYRLIGRRRAPEPIRFEDGKVILPTEIDALFDEARDAIEVARRIWDSWEDDAIIRDVSTWRFLDADKIHYADFVGEHFSVKGSSIVPRSPQGQPVVTVLGHFPRAWELGATSADVLFITPQSPSDAVRIISWTRQAEADVARALQPLHIYADLVVLLEDSGTAAEKEKAALDRQADGEWHSDARLVVGTASELIEHISLLVDAGITGVRLRPARSEQDLQRIVTDVIPGLESAGKHNATQAPPQTLRERLGLPEAINRYTIATQKAEVLS